MKKTVRAVGKAFSAVIVLVAVSTSWGIPVGAPSA